MKRRWDIRRCCLGITAASLTGLLGAWTLATAEEFSKRVYLGAGIGATQLEPEAYPDSFAQDLLISDDSDAGGHLALGYDINRFFSVEAYAADLGQAEAEFLADPLGSVDYQVFGISALGYFLNSRDGWVPGSDGFTGAYRRQGASLYGRAGLGFMNNDSTGVDYEQDYAAHAAFGIGLEYGFRNGLALRTELMSFDTDAQYLNVGILKRFGSVGDAMPVAAVGAAAAGAAAAALPEPAAAAALPLQSESAQAVVSPVTYFNFDESDLSADARAQLREFAQAVSQNELKLSIEGHTDWVASRTYNMGLSIRRAKEVADYLVGLGVDSSRISVLGYGETRPVATNDTEEGRAQNRRAEIRLM